MTDTPISIRIPADLLKKIDKLAEDDRRSRSGMIIVLLERGMKKK